MATVTEVREFLNAFRIAAKSPNGLILLRKHVGSKNSEGICSLGITEIQAKEEVFNLKTEDYSAGPEDDRDRVGQVVWKFSPIITGREVYVKLVLTADQRVKILSFHPADHPMPHPFRK